jgi:hypothetical protein
MGNGFTVSPSTPELNPSAQLCLTRFFTRDFGKTAGLLVLVHTCVRFVVLTPMYMKMHTRMLRNITPCVVVNIWRRFQAVERLFQGQAVSVRVLDIAAELIL